MTGITDREYEPGEGAAYKIYEDITYDRDIVYTVLFNTAAVWFDEPGTYGMTYWVYSRINRVLQAETMWGCYED